MVAGYNRIYVLGASGSGKTTVAKKISEILGLGCYDLDDILWERKYTIRRPLRELKKRVNFLAKRRKWVIEGVYSTWISSALKRSELVVWLDIPFGITAKRLIMRYLRKHGFRKLKNLHEMLRYSRRYKREEGPSTYDAHKELIDKHDLDFVIIKSKRDLRRLYKELKEQKEKRKEKTKNKIR